MKKIFIYGAGQLGINAVAYLVSSQLANKAEVVLYSPHNFKRVEGAIEDLKDAKSMIGGTSRWLYRATGCVDELENADFVVFCAGKFPQPEEYAQAALKGIDDRLLKAFQNIDILNQFCEEMKALNSKAKVFVVTNPVDLMTQIAREKLPQNEVYGLGCYLDTYRFKKFFCDLLLQNGVYAIPDWIDAWVVGHHCNTMFLHEESFHMRNTRYVVKEMAEQAMQRTKGRGLEITRINQQAATPKINNGSYFAPAVMIAKVLTACVTNQKLVLPLNRVITKNDNLPEFVGETAQLIAEINCGNIVAKPLPFLNSSDVEAMKLSLEGQKNARSALGV